jgi:hypothetical protein
MMSEVLGPIQLEAKVYFVNPETGDTATATYSFPPGRPVDKEAIESAFRKSAEAVGDTGFVLMAPSTFFNHVLVREKTGRIGNFATPRDFQYDAFGLELGDANRRDWSEDDEDEDEDEDDA